MSGRAERGFSLVELMVALLISLILLGGIIQVYLGNKETYTFGQALGRIQENGRFALDYLGKEIRMADYWGCSDFTDINNNLDPTSPDYVDFGATGGIGGADGTTDSITIAGAFGSRLSLKAEMTTVDKPVQVVDSADISAGDLVVLSDCLEGNIFQVTSILDDTDAEVATGNIGLAHGTNNNYTEDDGTTNTDVANSSINLSKNYEEDASLSPVRVTTFNIQNNPIGEPALYVATNGVSGELVEGVENMQIEYGEDTDSDGVPNRYVAAPSVTDMAEVIAVRISLLIRSFQDGVTDSPQTYTFNGATVTAGDNRLRQVFTSTISLRNRMN